MSDPDYGTGPGAIGETRRKSSSGLARVLTILAVIGGLGMLTCGGLAFWAMQQPEIREAVVAATETLGVVADAQNAPGAEELREAGCTQALVMDTAELFERLDALEGDDGEGELSTEAKADLINPVIVCTVSTMPDGGCDALAGVYLAAVAGTREPPESFAIQVTRAGFTSQEQCSFIYDGDGNRTGEFTEGGDASEEQLDEQVE